MLGLVPILVYRCRNSISGSKYQVQYQGQARPTWSPPIVAIHSFFSPPPLSLDCVGGEPMTKWREEGFVATRLLCTLVKQIVGSLTFNFALIEIGWKGGRGWGCNETTDCDCTEWISTQTNQHENCKYGGSYENIMLGTPETSPAKYFFINLLLFFFYRSTACAHKRQQTLAVTSNVLFRLLEL